MSGCAISRWGITSLSWLRKVRLDTIRLYFNAQNPFTITNLKMLDPETKGNYGTHPLFKVFSVGLMLKF